MMARQPGAVVLGSDYKALGVVRSLGRHGIPVWLVRDDHALANASRYTRRSLAWPAAVSAARARDPQAVAVGIAERAIPPRKSFFVDRDTELLCNGVDVLDVQMDQCVGAGVAGVSPGVPVAV